MKNETCEKCRYFQRESQKSYGKCLVGSRPKIEPLKYAYNKYEPVTDLCFYVCGDRAACDEFENRKDDL